MQLADHSNLKSTERVEIPLNGVTYYARPTINADVLLEAIGATKPEEISALVVALQAQENGREADVDTALMAQASAVAGKATNRAIMFMQVALEPKSAEKFASNMGSDGPEGITLAQVMAVYRDLVAHYGSDQAAPGAATRPTTPSLSTVSGRSPRGRTSTAGRPRKA